MTAKLARLVPRRSRPHLEQILEGIAAARDQLDRGSYRDLLDALDEHIAAERRRLPQPRRKQAAL